MKVRGLELHARMFDFGEETRDSIDIFIIIRVQFVKFHETIYDIFERKKKESLMDSDGCY